MDFELLPDETGLTHETLKLARESETRTIILYLLKSIKKRELVNKKEFIKKMEQRITIFQTNILKIIHFIEEKDSLYLILENFNGTSLKKFASLNRNLKESKIFLIALQIALVVSCFHNMKMAVGEINVS